MSAGELCPSSTTAYHYHMSLTYCISNTFIMVLTVENAVLSCVLGLVGQWVIKISQLEN